MYFFKCQAFEKWTHAFPLCHQRTRHTPTLSNCLIQILEFASLGVKLKKLYICFHTILEGRDYVYLLIFEIPVPSTVPSTHKKGY